MVLLEHAKIIETLIGKIFIGPDFNFQRRRGELSLFQKSQLRHPSAVRSQIHMPALPYSTSLAHVSPLNGGVRTV